MFQDLNTGCYQFTINESFKHLPFQCYRHASSHIRDKNIVNNNFIGIFPSISLRNENTCKKCSCCFQHKITCKTILTNVLLRTEKNRISNEHYKTAARLIHHETEPSCDIYTLLTSLYTVESCSMNGK